MVLGLELSAGAPERVCRDEVYEANFIAQRKCLPATENFIQNVFLLSANLRNSGLKWLQDALDSRDFIEKFMLSDRLQKQSEDLREFSLREKKKIMKLIC